MAQKAEFHLCKSKWHLPIAPVHIHAPMDGVYHYLDPLLMNYLPELGGVLLSLHDVEFMEDKGVIQAESPFSWAWIQATTLVWKPKKGMRVTGRVNLVSPSHIGLLLHATFNASIAMEENSEWEWVDDVEREEGGWWRHQGEEVKGILQFEVDNIVRIGKMISIEGTQASIQI